MNPIQILISQFTSYSFNAISRIYAKDLQVIS
jgi:hypothetical protein